MSKYFYGKAKTYPWYLEITQKKAEKYKIPFSIQSGVFKTKKEAESLNKKYYKGMARIMKRGRKK